MKLRFGESMRLQNFASLFMEYGTTLDLRSTGGLIQIA